MKIAMVGSGYVGLVSGACFADFGHEVVCIDKDQGKIDRLRDGIMPIYEPGLDKLVEGNVAAGRLTFSTDLADAIAGAHAIFIAVGTPSRRGDGHADLSFVYAVAEEIGAALRNDCVVVTKSTVPVGTGDEVERSSPPVAAPTRSRSSPIPNSCEKGPRSRLQAARPHRDRGRGRFRARGYERSLPSALPQRIADPVHQSPHQRADQIRRQRFLATKITFINEMADLCEKVGADVQDVSRGIGMDNRIGRKFLHAGPGYGGSCFPKDTLALLKTAEDYDSPTRIVEAVVKVNESRKRAMGRKVLDAIGGHDDARGKKVALLGLTFKPNTDDMRDPSPLPSRRR